MYSIEPIVNTHPGGCMIIHYIKGRDIDRFIYGTQWVEGGLRLDTKLTYSHSEDFLKKVGKPMAKINIEQHY